jgi:hypothetical protein
MPYLSPAKVVESLPSLCSGSYGSVVGSCVAHEISSFFLRVARPSSMFVSFQLHTFPPRAATLIYITLVLGEVLICLGTTATQLISLQGKSFQSVECAAGSYFSLVSDLLRGLRYCVKL